MANDSVAFVRKDMLPQQEPPISERGAVKWIRENLFPDWINSILTILALWFIVQIVVSAFPWFANGIWSTSSLDECREMLQGTTGACFSVLTERWNQLLFGFQYPTEEYWRPALAFVLLAVAGAPLLFWMYLPSRLLILTAIYPFVAYWLIWGGSVWVPIAVMAGLFIGYSVFQRLVAGSFAVASGAFVLILVFLFLNPVAWILNLFGAIAGLFASDPLVADFVFFIRVLDGEALTFSVRDPLYLHIVALLDAVAPISLPEVASRNIGGFMLNFILGTVCVSLSLPIGILLALGRQSHMPIIKWICVVFIEFIRGVPLITLLFVANVVLSYFFPPDSNLDLILRVIIMITAFASAYIAEVIRGGLAALPKGQYEAADSLGLDYAQSMRLIIMPQALKISIPGIVNVAVGLFKDTTLVSVISMFDLVGMIRGPILASTEWNGVYWELWGAAILLFFPVCYGISKYSQWLERQLATDHR